MTERQATHGAEELIVRMLEPTDEIPNHEALPLVICRDAVDIGDNDEPEARFEKIFKGNGWGGLWRDGIFNFHHFHTTAHEVLGIAHGEAEVQFGGPSGPILMVSAGDVVLIPAGTGHCRISGHDLSVVGAYPPGQEMDLWRAGKGDLKEARRNIEALKVPEKDPVFGEGGKILAPWLGR